ncbi:BON domain-containing protein [Cupriavidus necator]
MHPSRNEGGGSWWREDRDDDDARRDERGGRGGRGQSPGQRPGQGQGQWQGQGQRQGQWQGQGRGDDPRGYGEGRYGQGGGPARDYGEGRYEGRQWHESDVRERGYYGSREGGGQERREDWQQAGRRAPWEDDDTWRGSGSVRDEWGDSRRGMTGRQGGMEARRGRYDQGYGISDYASPGAQTRRPQSGLTRSSSYGRESGWDEDESGRTGMSEQPGAAGRRIGEPGKQAPGARAQESGAMRRGRDRVGPKGYQRSDERIREEICERLAHARHVDVRDVEVEVQGGVVRLTGNVQDRRQKYCIEEVVDDVFGVREIHNAIRLGSPGAFGVSGITEGAQGGQGVQGTSGSRQAGASGQGHVSSSGRATGSSASSYGAGMETGSGGPGMGRDSTGGTTRIG